MHFYATSAQIANEFGYDHELVMQTVKSLNYSSSFMEQIQVFDLGPITLAQVTEPGYNAIVMNLPQDAGGDDELLTKWKEAFLFNKAPSLTSLTSPVALPNTINSPVPRNSLNKNAISDAARKQAEELISSGECDSIISEPYSTIHKELRDRLNGDDAGYQNVRLYVMARRKVLGL